MDKQVCDIAYCNNYLKLDTHHIHSKCYGGGNQIWNKCKLCPNCHRKIHVGELVLEGWWSSSNGRILVYRAKNEPSITGYTPKVWLFSDNKKTKKFTLVGKDRVLIRIKRKR